MAGSEIVREGLFFGESPRWHEGRLWYSDFYDRAVHALHPSGVDERILEVEGQPSGLGWLPDGSLLVVSMVDRRVLRRDPLGNVGVHADLDHLATFHVNDLVVDAHGRAYVGNFGFDLDAFLAEHGVEGLLGEPGPSATVLARVDPDGSVHVAAHDVVFPNGAVLTPDGRTLILAETLALRLSAFDVAADGTLSGRRVWADLSASMTAPDGICLDAEGAVWVANALAPQCRRIGAGGAILDEVTFSQNCFACMLGGDDRRVLYAMTAPTSVAADASARRDGRIEAATVAVPGAGRP